MSYAAKILCDSVAPNGARLTTMEVQFPRFILAEFNTHRKFSRNSASSRAIPVERRIKQVIDNPFVPESFGKNRKGMQAGAAVSRIAQFMSEEAWLRARDACAREAETLVKNEVHKQHANRLIELWAWHTVVVTSSDWRNFFALRDHKAAQPEMQITALHMRVAFEASKPEPLAVGDWHLPYIDGADWAESPMPSDETLVARSVVRCAAVSFERQDAERTPEQIQTRHDEMVRMAHWSPFEHQAKVANAAEIRKCALYRWVNETEASDTLAEDFVPVLIGNLDVPFLQYRKTFDGEAVFRGGA